MPQARLGKPWTADQCYLCWKCLNDPAYSELYGCAKPEKSMVQEVSRASCKHLGSATGETEVCPPCGGNVRIKLYICAVHQKCTLAKVLDGFACCQTCPDYHAA